MYLPRAEELSQLAARYVNNNNCYYYSNGTYSCHSAWYRWGRWVLAGILILIAIFLILLVLCLARRRRSRASRYNTQTPMTAPAGGYYNNNQTYNAPPGPPPPNYGADYNANNGYYGQQTGVAQPQTAYVK